MVTYLGVGYIYWTFDISIYMLYALCTLGFYGLFVWWFENWWRLWYSFPYTFFEMPRYINFYGMLLQFFVVLLGSGLIFEELFNVCWIHSIKKDFPKQLSKNPRNTFRWAFYTNLQLIKFNPCATGLYLMHYWMYVYFQLHIDYISRLWLWFSALIILSNWG